MISRRGFLASAAMSAVASSLGSGLCAATAATPDPLLPLWKAWKLIHVSSSGRVIDRLQDNVSHSEGQGYALLVAEALGDREGFDLILAWTLANLAVRDDALLAWRWHPANGGGVTDTNNATDGDLFTAWALMRAADRFGEPRYGEIGTRIAADISRLCLIPSPGSAQEWLLLIPGVEGFATSEGVVVNPAYYMLRAMREIGEQAAEPRLVAAAADGNAMLSRLARERLVPDWVRVTSEGFSPDPEKSRAFGYEALRVPLYLIWSGLPGHPAVARAREAYRASLGEAGETIPVVIDPETGETRETSSDPGYRALAALTACAGGARTGGLMPAFTAGQPYYPGVLQLLSLLAQRESTLGCYVR